MVNQIYRLHYSVRRHFVDQFYIYQVSSLTKEQKNLDLGGHKTIKRGLFHIERYNLQVVYANISPKKGTDVQADALQVPCCNNSFDVIICSELLEHVSYPPQVLREAWRLLKPQGILLITVPFLYPIHGDPYDFGRYTDYYWLSELKKLGFQDISLLRQGLFYSVLINFCKSYVSQLGLSGPIGSPVRYILTVLLAITQYLALKYEQTSHPQKNSFIQSFTTGFGIWAVKP